LEVLLLLVLLIGAGALLMPGFLRERILDSPVDSISDFRRGMTALAISTHNYKPINPGYYLSSTGGDPEPYVRRSSYGSFDDEASREEIVPYPSNRTRAYMETRRSRIIAILLVVTLITGICAIIPNLRWIIPVHLTMLLILAIYIGLVILLPHYERHG
jgi:hypothetical protein